MEAGDPGASPALAGSYTASSPKKHRVRERLRVPGWVGVQHAGQANHAVPRIGFREAGAHGASIRKRSRAVLPTIFWASSTLQARKTASMAPRV